MVVPWNSREVPGKPSMLAIFCIVSIIALSFLTSKAISIRCRASSPSPTVSVYDW